MWTRNLLYAFAISMLITGTGLSCSKPQRQSQSGESPAPLNPRLQQVREFVMEEVATGNAPSLSIAVALNGEVLWEEAFGWADRENRIRATPHTKYQSGSMAKPITATAVMRMVEAGVVDLDKPIEKYLEGLTLHYHLGTPEETTVRRVLQHRAGLPPHNQIFFLDETPERRPFEETVRRYGNVMFQPGWSFIYANLGFQLLARVVEQASGMDFPSYVRANVFSPLGMETAQIYVGDDLPSPTATSYYGVNDEPVPRNTSAYPGNGDMYCSAHDLLRFAMFHLKDHLPDQSHVLGDSMIDAMQKEEPPDTSYGLGWSFDVDDMGFRSVYHGGQTTGVSNFMVLIPSEDLALVILSNTDYPASKLLHIQGAIRAGLIPGYEGVNPWTLTEADQREAESGSSEEPAQDQVPAREVSEELLGTWKGRIVAYDKEIGVTLVITDEDATITLEGQEEHTLSFSVVTAGFVRGTFPGSIPTADLSRYEQSVRLALVRRGDSLSGQATAVGWREDRQTDSELSSWVELVKQ